MFVRHSRSGDDLYIYVFVDEKKRISYKMLITVTWTVCILLLELYYIYYNIDNGRHSKLYE